MKYIYTYKTSDGVRHEATIHAPTREAVFEALRPQGIKPIKVIAADGSKANGEVHGLRKRIAFAVAVITLVVGVVVGVNARRVMPAVDPMRRYTGAEAKAYRQLFDDQRSLHTQLAAEYAVLHVEKLSDYAAIATATNVVSLYKIAERCSALIERSRKAMRTLFSRVAASFPQDGAALVDVQKLYGDSMSQIDALEISLSNRKYALAILDENRGKWEIKDGRPSFSDHRLSKMFDYCLEGINTSAETARWRQDFSPDLK